MPNFIPSFIKSIQAAVWHDPISMDIPSRLIRSHWISSSLCYVNQSYEQKPLLDIMTYYPMAQKNVTHWTTCPGWRNRGTGRDLPLLLLLLLLLLLSSEETFFDLLRAPLIPFRGWDPGDQYITEKGPFLLLLDCFLAIPLVYRWVWALWDTLWTLFLGAPKA